MTFTIARLYLLALLVVKINGEAQKSAGGTVASDTRDEPELPRGTSSGTAGMPCSTPCIPEYVDGDETKSVMYYWCRTSIPWRKWRRLKNRGKVIPVGYRWWDICSPKDGFTVRNEACLDRCRLDLSSVNRFHVCTVKNPDEVDFCSLVEDAPEVDDGDASTKASADSDVAVGAGDSNEDVPTSNNQSLESSYDGSGSWSTDDFP